jgi:hypothetical protein
LDAVLPLPIGRRRSAENPSSRQPTTRGRRCAGACSAGATASVRSHAGVNRMDLHTFDGRSGSLGSQSSPSRHRADVCVPGKALAALLPGGYVNTALTDEMADLYAGFERSPGSRDALLEAATVRQRSSGITTTAVSDQGPKTRAMGRRGPLLSAFGGAGAGGDATEARLVVIESTGLFSHEKRAEVVNGELVDWLEEGTRVPKSTFAHSDPLNHEARAPLAWTWQPRSHCALPAGVCQRHRFLARPLAFLDRSARRAFSFG